MAASRASAASYAYAKLGVIRLSEKLAVALGRGGSRGHGDAGHDHTSIGRNDGAAAHRAMARGR